jgi:hypothetical protein
MHPSLEMSEVLENLWCEMATLSISFTPSSTNRVSKDSTARGHQRDDLESLSSVFGTTLAVEDIEMFAPFMQSSIHTSFIEGK